MGLLDAIFSAGDSAKRRIRGLLDDPVGSLEQTAGMLSDDRKLAAERNARMISDPATVSSSDVQALLGGGASFAPMGLTVWHGSPHKFSKFDMSKIGTGEGAQAYGHGLYMAESPSVAQEYQKNVTALRMPTDSISDAEVAAAKKVLNIFGPKDGMIQAKRMFGDRTDEIVAKANDVTGQLYKVDIPDEAVARFLDWDKKLSEQAPEVQKALLNSGYAETAFKKELGIDKVLGLPEYTGKDLYQALKVQGGKDNSSALLQQQGIPGIRYLDGGSRSAGQGSSNYVLFSDQLPRILETNGVPTGQVPWKPGEFGLLGM